LFSGKSSRKGHDASGVRGVLKIRQFITEGCTEKH